MASGSTTSATNVAVLDVVILVDESGSETPAKVADEKQTAGTIAQSMLNPRSRVTVIGFGGVNHVVPDQNPVDVVCPPTIANSAAKLSYLASCVNSLHRRTEAEGDDTDYAAALGQAMTYFDPATASGQQSPAGAIKAVLMMTDGGVDVHRNPQQYGTAWRSGEEQAVTQQLAVARQDNVQLWPLGFGTDITGQDASYLSQLAKGGAQIACDSRPESQPHYQVVNSPANAVNALDTLYAEAGCLGTSTSSPTTVGGEVQASALQVTIPPIASDAAISVDRGNPGVQVSYQMPGGQQWADPSAISGQGSPVEVLHLNNLTAAETGTWTIKLTAAPRLASQLVDATVFWQGAVRAVMTANPPSAGLGQPIAVTLSVFGPNGPIVDRSTLSRLQVGVRVSGDGQAGSTPVQVSNAGGTRGSPAGQGEYMGTYLAPRRSGVLTFTGKAAGYGLYDTEIPVTVQVAQDMPAFVATVQPPLSGSVQAGASIEGQVTFVNETGVTREVRLELYPSRALALVTSPPGPLAAASGGSSADPFAIVFSKNSPVGSAWLEVKAVDAADPSLVYSDVTFALTVTAPSGFRPPYRWMTIAVIVLLVLVLFLGSLWLRYADVRGLIAILRRDGEQAGPELAAPSNKWSSTFRFIVHNSDDKPFGLDYPKPRQSGHVYALRRTRRGGVRLRTPAGPRYDIAIDGPGELLEAGSELAFRDAHRRREPGFRVGPKANWGAAGAPDPVKQPGTEITDLGSTTTPAPGPEQGSDWI